MSATCTRPLYGRQQCRALLELGVDPLGRTVARCPKCDRTKLGLCRDCPGKVTGRELWCAGCRLERRRASGRRHMADPANRRRRNAANRRRWRKDPARRARKREIRRAWGKRNPDRVKRHRRRYVLKRTPAYVAGYERNNARPDRQAAKRAQAIARYYELHPVRPSPVCATCSKAIPWKPRHGRPPKYCYQCSPWKSQRKRPDVEQLAEREVA